MMQVAAGQTFETAQVQEAVNVYCRARPPALLDPLSSKASPESCVPSRRASASQAPRRKMRLDDSARRPLSSIATAKEIPGSLSKVQVEINLPLHHQCMLYIEQTYPRVVLKSLRGQPC